MRAECQVCVPYFVCTMALLMMREVILFTSYFCKYTSPPTSHVRISFHETSLLVQRLRLYAPKAGSPGFDAWSGNQIPHATAKSFHEDPEQPKKERFKERKKESPSYILERNEQNELLASSLTLEHSPHCENCPVSLAEDRRDDTHNFFLLLFFQQKFWPRGMRFDHETSYRLKHRQMAEA